MANPLPDKLHLGCGRVTPDDWLNVDGSWGARLHNYPVLYRLALTLTGKTDGFSGARHIFGHDLRRPLPWADNSFSAVYASHLLEHLHVDDAERLLKECLRVLRPGGVARFVVPDLDPLIKGYQTGEFPAWTKDYPALPTRADTMVQALLMQPSSRPRGRSPVRVYDALVDFHSHKWMYNAESIGAAMRRAGFADISNPPCWESRIPGIDQIEMRKRVENGAGVVGEGVKPA